MTRSSVTPRLRREGRKQGGREGRRERETGGRERGREAGREGGREGGSGYKRRTLAIFPEAPLASHIVFITLIVHVMCMNCHCVTCMVTLNCNVIQPCVAATSCHMHSLWVCTAVLGPDADGVAGSGLKVQLLCRLHASSVHRDVELIHVARHDGVLNLTKRTKIIVYGTHL